MHFEKKLDCIGQLVNLFSSYFLILFREDPCNLKVQISENTILGISSDVQIIRVDKIIVHKDYCKYLL